MFLPFHLICTCVWNYKTLLVLATFLPPHTSFVYVSEITKCCSFDHVFVPHLPKKIGTRSLVTPTSDKIFTNTLTNYRYYSKNSIQYPPNSLTYSTGPFRRPTPFRKPTQIFFNGNFLGTESNHDCSQKRGWPSKRPWIYARKKAVFSRQTHRLHTKLHEKITFWNIWSKNGHF